MRFVLVPIGTLGDLYPFLALGTALRDHGHSVAVAAAPAVHEHVREAGLEVYACRPDLGPEVVREFHAAFDHWPGDPERDSRKTSRQELVDVIRQRVSDLLPVCRGADALIFNSAITGEAITAEILEIPGIHAVTAAERVWNVRVQAFFRELESPGAAENTERANEFFQWHQTCRLEAGLDETPRGGWAGYFLRPALLAASPHFLAPFDLASWNATVCGFWFHESPRWSQWEPDPELAAFMERRPIVLSLSSQPVADPPRVVETHVEAARLVGRPILVQSGWAGLSGTDGADVLFRGFLPQDWLFARAACVIHHGGAGTIARALRNACPMVVEPWGNDQFFNAWMVLKGGWGAAVNPKKIGATELARIVSEKVLSDETRRRVALTARDIRNEDGVGTAVAAVIAQLGGGSKAGRPG